MTDQPVASPTFDAEQTEVEPDTSEAAEPSSDPIPFYDKHPDEGGHEIDRPDEEQRPGGKPRFFVAGSTFYAQTEDGELQIPLRIRTKHFRKVAALGAEDEIDQLYAMLEIIGDEATSERLGELDLFETAAIAARYFDAWQQKRGASLGEARRSSRS